MSLMTKTTNDGIDLISCSKHEHLWKLEGWSFTLEDIFENEKEPEDLKYISESYKDYSFDLIGNHDSFYICIVWNDIENPSNRTQNIYPNNYLHKIFDMCAARMDYMKFYKFAVLNIDDAIEQGYCSTTVKRILR